MIILLFQRIACRTSHQDQSLQRRTPRRKEAGSFQQCWHRDIIVRLGGQIHPQHVLLWIRACIALTSAAAAPLEDIYKTRLWIRCCRGVLRMQVYRLSLEQCCPCSIGDVIQVGTIRGIHDPLLTIGRECARTRVCSDCRTMHQPLERGVARTPGDREVDGERLIKREGRVCRRESTANVERLTLDRAVVRLECSIRLECLCVD